MTEKYFIYLHKRAEKALYKIPKLARQRIEKIIDGLEIDPYLGVKMNGELAHLRKIKLANYRIIYQVIESKIVIEILEIESRGNMSYDR